MPAFLIRGGRCLRRQDRESDPANELYSVTTTYLPSDQPGTYFANFTNTFVAGKAASA